MMDIVLLYVFTRLNPLNELFIGLAVLSTFSAFSCVVFGCGEYGNKHLLKWIKPAIAALIVGVLGAVLVPTQKDAALILAGSAVLDVARSETAGRLASKSVQLIEQTLDGYLKKPEGK